jgi:oxygen-independent coproporphyrinogen-3 oxidase
MKKNSIRTLFIGGGTPSTVDPQYYERFFDILNPFLEKNAEITTEANPNSATKAWLEGMQKLGINRISFGTQTFDAKKLQFLNRAHTAEDTRRAVNDAYALGIKNLSIDLIYATSMDSKALLENDLKQAFSLPINHISAYALTIEEGTKFFETPEVAKEQLENTQWFLEAIKEAGFRQYEISNFGKGYQSVHNRGYWEYDNYLGIGAGAVGCISQTRYYPHSDVQAYIEDPIYVTEESLSDMDVKAEKLLLGLRSCVGFSLDDLSAFERERVDVLVKEEKLRLEGDRLFNDDYLLADELALFILS